MCPSFCIIFYLSNCLNYHHHVNDCAMKCIWRINKLNWIKIKSRPIKYKKQSWGHVIQINRNSGGSGGLMYDLWEHEPGPLFVTTVHDSCVKMNDLSNLYNMQVMHEYQLDITGSMLRVAFYLRVFNKIKNHVKQIHVFLSWTEYKICIDVIVILGNKNR